MIDSDIFEETYQQRRNRRDREAIALLQAQGLVTQWEAVIAASEAEARAEQEAKNARQKYTDMLAEALKVKIDMRVTRTKNKSWRDPQVITQTFVVTGYRLSLDPSKLTLKGRLIRKDGTPGVDITEIGTEWERVKEEPVNG